MASIIKIKRSDTATSVPSSLENGELAVNTKDGILYVGNSSAVVTLARSEPTLGTHTSGDYVASFTAGGGLTGDASGEGSTPTIAVGAGTGITVNADDVALDTSSTRNTDHASVTLTAGNGLTGGGDITTNRSFAVGAGNGITVNADDVAVNGANGITVAAGGVFVASANGIDVSTGGVAVVAADATISVTTSGVAAVPGQIDHDSLLNFVANEHVDHSSVTLTAGNGLTGGGDITTSRSFAVGAGDGITVNADDVAVNGANGILVTSDGVNVQAGNNTLFIDATGAYVNTDALPSSPQTIAALTDTTITTPDDGAFLIYDTGTSAWRDFSLSGDVTCTDQGVVTIAADAVTLGTDTTGNYVATISATANETSVSGSGSETAAVTVGLADNVTIPVNLTVTGNTSVGGNLQVTGNLDVDGTLTYIDSTTVYFGDNLLLLANNNTTGDSVDFGFYGRYANSGAIEYSGLARDATDGVWKFFKGLTSDPSNTITFPTPPATIEAVIDGGTF